MEKQTDNRLVSDRSPLGPIVSDEEVKLTKEHVSALLGADHRTISSMPIVVSYQAKIALVKRTDGDSQIAFRTTRWMDGKVGREESWREEQLDAYKVRDEFLQVANPRQALDFLRETGEFLPLGDPITWDDFLRWQRLAEVVIEHDSLAELIKTNLAGQSNEKLDPSGELKQIWMMLTGVYPHTYFKDATLSLTAKELEDLRRVAEISSETPRQVECEYSRLLEAIKQGHAIQRKRQRDLECWFYAPPPKSYSVEFVPQNPTADFVQNVQRGGALLDYIHPLEDLLPVLVIRPSCTLEAIAASVYADRIAGIKSRKCPGCRKWFEIGSQKTKKYCDDTCRERMKKQRQRAGS